MIKYVGKICDRHPQLRGERRNGNCPECQRERMRTPEYRVRHRALKDPVVHRRAVKKWREENSERYKSAAHARNAVRRARKKSATEASAEARMIWREMSREARCWGLTIDHSVPLAGCRVCGAVGTHSPDNWRFMWPRDNASKGNRCRDCWHGDAHDDD